MLIIIIYVDQCLDIFVTYSFILSGLETLQTQRSHDKMTADHKSLQLHVTKGSCHIA